MLRVIAIAGLLTGLAPSVARGAAWHRPVSGGIVGTYSFSPGDPYAAGQRRGIVLRATPGETVRSACTGRVVFAGPVGRAGPTLSVQCGRLRATYQGLAPLAVREGLPVRRGAPVATVGPRGALRLGARAGRHAYVDPATLFDDPRAPLGPAPRGRPARPRWPTEPWAVPRPRPRFAGAPPAQPAPAPVLAWIGLAGLAAAVPAGTLMRGRARRRRTTERAVSSPV